jgi:hypothetical protein
LSAHDALPKNYCMTPAETPAHPDTPQKRTREEQVRDASGVRWVRVLYRSLNQHFDYKTLPMQPTGKPDEYAATIPGADLSTKWDFEYFFEVMDTKAKARFIPISKKRRHTWSSSCSADDRCSPSGLGRGRANVRDAAPQRLPINSTPSRHSFSHGTTHL